MTGSAPLDQGSKRTTALLANPFDRFDLGAQRFGWRYGYQNAEMLHVAPITTSSLEIAVQLAGDWVTMWGAAPEQIAPGEVFVVPALVRHRYSFASCEVLGLQVGFALPPCVDGRCLAVGSISNGWRRRLVELAWEVAQGRHTDVNAVLDAFVNECTTVVDDGPVDRARVLLAETADRPLYLEHIADMVGLHQKTLSRRFVACLGVTPIRFRTELRLQRAIRLLWSRLDLPVAEVAAAVGFDDARFFYRLARSAFGLTPAQLGRREPTRGQRIESSV